MPAVLKPLALLPVSPFPLKKLLALLIPAVETKIHCPAVPAMQQMQSDKSVRKPILHHPDKGWSILYEKSSFASESHLSYFFINIELL